MLCAAWVVLTAGRGAGGVVAAVGYALVAPFLTDVEREGLGELGEVRGEAVGADAGVGEGLSVAGVLAGLGGVGGGLEADAGAVSGELRVVGGIGLTVGIGFADCCTSIVGGSRVRYLGL